MKTIPNKCERCGENLSPGREVWLAYDQRTKTYTDQDVPAEFDQGGFPFGKACAKRELERDQKTKNEKAKQ